MGRGAFRPRSVLSGPRCRSATDSARPASCSAAVGSGSALSFLLAALLVAGAGLGLSGYLFGMITGQTLTLVILLVGILPSASRRSPTRGPGFCPRFATTARSPRPGSPSTLPCGSTSSSPGGWSAARRRRCTPKHRRSRGSRPFPCLAWVFVEVETRFHRRFRRVLRGLGGRCASRRASSRRANPRGRGGTAPAWSHLRPGGGDRLSAVCRGSMGSWAEAAGRGDPSLPAPARRIRRAGHRPARSHSPLLLRSPSQRLPRRRGSPAGDHGVHRGGIGVRFPPSIGTAARLFARCGPDLASRLSRRERRASAHVARSAPRCGCRETRANRSSH